MKRVLIVGVASLALSAMPVVSTFAATSYTDTINVTVSSSCTIARKAYASGGVTNNTSHKNGTDGTWSTTANTDSLSATRSNGTTTDSLGSSQFNVVCNDPDGWKVTFTGTSLTSAESKTIPVNKSYSASTSGWAVKVSSTKYASGEVIATATSTTAGTAVEVTYGVGINSTQAAGTYTGTATFTVAGL